MILPLTTFFCIDRLTLAPLMLPATYTISAINPLKLDICTYILTPWCWLDSLLALGCWIDTAWDPGAPLHRRDTGSFNQQAEPLQKDFTHNKRSLHHILWGWLGRLQYNGFYFNYRRCAALGTMLALLFHYACSMNSILPGGTMSFCRWSMCSELVLCYKLCSLNNGALQLRFYNKWYGTMRLVRHC